MRTTDEVDLDDKYGNNANRRSKVSMITTAQRRRLVLKYKKQGWSYTQIAKILEKEVGKDNLPKSWNRSYAAQDLSRLLDKYREELQESTIEMVQIELQRLDDMLVSIMDIATDNDGDFKATDEAFKAIDRVLKIMERRARYMGLDEPDSIKLTGDKDEPVGFTWANPDDAPDWDEE